MSKFVGATTDKLVKVDELRDFFLGLRESSEEGVVLRLNLVGVLAIVLEFVCFARSASSWLSLRRSSAFLFHF